MENQTRFDLNAAIANWLRELTAQAELTPIVLRELETHLRDTLAELQARGLNDEESFWLARRRIGSPRQLGEEFAKSDPARMWRDRAFWMVLVLLVTALWQSTVNSSINCFQNYFLSHMKIEGFIGVRIIFMFTGWLPILIGALLLSKGRFHSVITNRLTFFNSRVRVAITVFSWIWVVAILNAVDMTLMSKHTTFDRYVWISTLMTVIIPAIWPICLAGVLLWIMPRRLHSPVQHA